MQKRHGLTRPQACVLLTSARLEPGAAFDPYAARRAFTPTEAHSLTFLAVNRTPDMHAAAREFSLAMHQEFKQHLTPKQCLVLG